MLSAPALLNDTKTSTKAIFKSTVPAPAAIKARTQIYFFLSTKEEFFKLLDSRRQMNPLNQTECSKIVFHCNLDLNCGAS